jgi:hypothetical protein
VHILKKKKEERTGEDKFTLVQFIKKLSRKNNKNELLDPAFLKLLDSFTYQFVPAGGTVFHQGIF